MVTIPPWNQPNGHNDPNLQLSISTSKPDHIAELLEAKRKITRNFKKSYKHKKSHHANNDNNYPSISHNSSLHSDKHTCNTCNTSNQVNDITGQTWTSKNTKSEPEDTKDNDDSDSPDSNLDSSLYSEWLSQTYEIIEVKLSNMKYATNFPVAINKNNSLCLTQE